MQLLKVLSMLLAILVVLSSCTGSANSQDSSQSSSSSYSQGSSSESSSGIDSQPSESDSNGGSTASGSSSETQSQSEPGLGSISTSVSSSESHSSSSESSASSPSSAVSSQSSSQGKEPDNSVKGTIKNDTVWKDTDGNEIWAQGGCIFREGDTFHWFGPKLLVNTGTGFYAINHYTSKDLSTWKKEAPALTPDMPNSPFAKGTWMGRQWVLYNKHTKKYVMITKCGKGGSPQARDRFAFLTSSSLYGPWNLDNIVERLPDTTGALYSMGDLGAFQDDDGNAYIMYVSDKNATNRTQFIAKLDPSNYTRVLSPQEGGIMAEFAEAPREAPSIVKRGSTYYYFTSECKGWSSTQTHYRTASKMSGPWSEEKDLATNPHTIDSLNTQHDFILPVTGSKTTTYIYCGDRWSNMTDVGIGKNAWYPLIFDSKGVPTTAGHKTWTINITTGEYTGDEIKPITNLVKNPGFEEDGATTQTPKYWQTSGDAQADRVGTDGTNTGSFKLGHWLGTDYKVDTYQTITGLSNGKYTLRAWVKSGGDQNQCYVYAKDYGGNMLTKQVPSDYWNQIEIRDIEVTNGQCTIGAYSDSPGGKWMNIDDISFYKQ